MGCRAANVKNRELSGEIRSYLLPTQLAEVPQLAESANLKQEVGGVHPLDPLGVQLGAPVNLNTNHAKYQL